MNEQQDNEQAGEAFEKWSREMKQGRFLPIKSVVTGEFDYDSFTIKNWFWWFVSKIKKNKI